MDLLEPSRLDTYSSPTEGNMGVSLLTETQPHCPAACLLRVGRATEEQLSDSSGPEQ